LALSGGGFRAAAFHLGVLKRLDELRLLHKVSLMSTVSGGSITGALYALRCREKGDGTPGSYPIDGLITDVRYALRSNLRGQAFFGSPLSVLRTVTSFVVPAVSRMPLIVRELETLYRGAQLAQLPSWIVINATNLVTGKNWKFFADRAGDYAIGATADTARITVAQAVGASAAYPVLVDPYPFATRWEQLRTDLIDDRWERPGGNDGAAGSWRRRFGRENGRVTLPLIDGGVYDNEGINALRGAKMTHAIVSSVDPAESSYFGNRRLPRLLRVIDVMHSRLGAVTRQHAYEMTHGASPDTVREALNRLATTLDGTDADHLLNAREMRKLARVGLPPRGHQFTALAPILLHRTDLAQNWSAAYDEPYDIPPDLRGVPETALHELSRVRTDLDALEDGVFSLLMAQAYFLTDAHLKVSMPDILESGSLKPNWALAREMIKSAHDNLRSTVKLLRIAQRRSLLGRMGSIKQAARVWGSLVLTAVIFAVVVIAVAVR